jgi:hypothetical protein
LEQREKVKEDGLSAGVCLLQLQAEIVNSANSGELVSFTSSGDSVNT